MENTAWWLFIGGMCLIFAGAVLDAYLFTRR